MRTIQHHDIKWIDVLNPTDDDMRSLEEKFGFHHLILEEIKTPTYHPLLEFYKTYVFVILHFPHQNYKRQQIQPAEVDFIITSDTLITFRYNKFYDFDALSDEINGHPEYFSKTTGHLFYRIIKGLNSRMFPELDRIKESVDRTEDEIFERFDEKVIERIADTKREVLDFIRALKPQKAVWDAMPGLAMRFWGERTQPYISDLIADYNRVLHFAETHREIIDSLHLTSSSILDNRQNTVMKTLTIFTAIVLPLSLVASIYGMNLAHLPYASHPFAFWWFLFGMVAASAGMLLYFRRRKWL